MYLRTSRAAVWIDGGSSEAVSIGRRRYPEHLTLGASAPFLGRLGRYVSIQLRGSDVFVAVAGNPMKWLPAQRALTEAEAKRWAREGFGEQRPRRQRSNRSGMVE